MSNKHFQKIFGLINDNHQVTAAALERISKMVRSLKSFSGLDEAEFQKINIHEGLDSTITLIQHEIKDGVSVLKEYGELLRQAYRRKKNNNTLAVIFSAEDFNQAFQRWQYLKQYDEYRKKQATL